jgi:hypothetical protein
MLTSKASCDQTAEVVRQDSLLSSGIRLYGDRVTL